MTRDRRTHGSARRSFGALWHAIRIAMQALANSGGVASAAGDDPRTDRRARRQPDVPH
ncbi:hypothetical protein KZX37_01745 [Microbacterium sp. EYE_5]|uniref:hypothetical protein n=1 Tax=unclassified Microbacterium TaxID=2609290 RepID=UPI0020030277|nr:MULTISPECIES: hypothetical protein [unclassified Microbacterium]MCK6079341.1 hypothetical protein [Microbacterium sp. EYE_382]MCK6084611.1 hypothetical protein [Microbacterium sp. EYE_384]MCK6123160.1 hypothetical protein [Microbacterium sp. EYE_80]MCK6125375.1 hypothetical protein [Microbacterium sp. EYE_79]MCK6140295.1 hypothetical protein [Microbacterium sp. EYE_39]